MKMERAGRGKSGERVEYGIRYIFGGDGYELLGQDIGGWREQLREDGVVRSERCEEVVGVGGVPLFEVV